jgi:hypothetical protein
MSFGMRPPFKKLLGLSKKGRLRQHNDQKEEGLVYGVRLSGPKLYFLPLPSRLEICCVIAAKHTEMAVECRRVLASGQIQQMGARTSYNPKNKGKKSYQPILTFMAETREHIGGELRNGDQPTGKQIARHLEGVFAAVPRCVRKIYARADAGFIVGKR